MKLSIVILCWNDLPVIDDCLRSIYGETRDIDFEVIVSDNGSTNGSREYISQTLSQRSHTCEWREPRFCQRQ